MTDKQKRAFWGQLAAACRNLGITSEDKESYRHAVLAGCVNTIKEIQQWKWKKDEKTNTYTDEPVNFFDDAMAMLRYSIEEERRTAPRLNRTIKGGI